MGWIRTVEVNWDAELEPGEPFCLCVSPGLSLRFTLVDGSYIFNQQALLYKMWVFVLCSLFWIGGNSQVNNYILISRLFHIEFRIQNPFIRNASTIMSKVT